MQQRKQHATFKLKDDICFNIDLNGRTTMYQCGDNKNWRFVRQLVLTSLVSLHSCASLPPLCLSWPISVCRFRWNACGLVYEIGSGHNSRVANGSKWWVAAHVETALRTVSFCALAMLRVFATDVGVLQASIWRLLRAKQVASRGVS